MIIVEPWKGLGTNCALCDCRVVVDEGAARACATSVDAEDDSREEHGAEESREHRRDRPTEIEVFVCPPSDRSRAELGGGKRALIFFFASGE